ncbi:MAG: triose-phosphate isomerase [Chloroflexi bacterium]|nr:triose-phosphate isomerase [Chloroflexota bacterium]
MDRIPLIAGNWKMNTTVEEAKALVQAMLPALEEELRVEKVVCPPFVSLNAVAKLAEGTSLGVGAQNMYFEDKGAFTGEISPLMLKGLCAYVILGHSERRAVLGEKDSFIGQKVAAAINHRLKPIVCVGENAQQRESGWAESVVVTQLRAALGGVPFDPGIVVAYEPVWAIGTGKAATAQTANEMCSLIRRELVGTYTQSRAQQVRILYGGSVTAQNIGEFASQPEIDGALVGGASLRAEDFVAIVKATALVAQAKGAQQG